MNENMYKDILNTPYPNRETEKDFPAEVNRAAQFAPYAALSGYGDAVEETARLTQRKIDHDEGVKEELSRKIQYLMCHDAYVTLTYFKPDLLKEGGEYVTYKGVIDDIREFEREIILADGTTVPVDDIYSIAIGGLSELRF